MTQQPLAWRMRPHDLSEIVGQQHLVGPGQVIERMVRAKRLTSMILYGPPGTGKTSIASAIAGSSHYAFRTLNAATDTQKDLQAVAEEGRMSGTVVLLLDEIHRLTKTKQDFLLPLLEKGQIILIGATTENPYMSINPAIRSRLEIFEVYSLTPADILIALKRALADNKKGLARYQVQVAPATLEFLAERTNGDLRSALNTLELAVLSTPPAKDGTLSLTLADMEASLHQKQLSFDKNGDHHYDTISAFQKSIRGSDVDAALHYLARLLEGGDLAIILRRLTVIAYEDIGLANMAAATHTLAAVQAAERLGLPEAQIPLADAVIELCLSSKSNSGYLAIAQARQDIQSGKGGSIPDYLKDAHYQGAAALKHGTGYQYPHNFANDWVKQQYLPTRLIGTQYFYPKGNGRAEAALKTRYERLRQAQGYPYSPAPPAK